VAQPLLLQKRKGGMRRGEVAAADEKYFDSYSHFGIHREMLSDKVCRHFNFKSEIGFSTNPKYSKACCPFLHSPWNGGESPAVMLLTRKFEACLTL